MLVNLALLGLWLALYRGIYPYLGVIFTRQEFRTNQVVLLAVLALVGWQARQGRLRPRLDALPRLHLPALALALGGALAYLLLERFLDINTFAAALFALASYGLLGLWLDPRPWRQGFPAALLLAGALPFGEHMQTFIGYPARLLTAEIVRSGLTSLGAPTLGAETILVFETGLAKVDLPCSGVQSLWTGGLFFLAATWIERRAIGVRWLLAAAGLGGLLLAANLVRVGVLVTVGMVLGQTLLAEMLHVPLGVLGFAAACGLGWLLLRLCPPVGATGRPPLRRSILRVGGAEADLAGLKADPPGRERVGSVEADPPGRERVGGVEADLAGLKADPPGRERVGRKADPPGRERVGRKADLPGRERAGLEADPPGRERAEAGSPVLALGLGAAVLAMALLYAPRPAAAAAPLLSLETMPAGLSAEAWPMTPGEQRWLAQAEVETAQRWRFEWRGLRGSLLLVSSFTWRAHHRPERCFEVYGLSVESVSTVLAAPDFPVRLLSLSGPPGDQGAAYWLQTAGYATDDYAARIWADLNRQRQRWVLVTVLFDGPVDPAAGDPQALYAALRQAVAAALPATQKGE